MSFIKFTEIAPPSDKTKRWMVSNQSGSIILGVIKWYAPWRRYCYFPLQDTVLDVACLGDIVTFIENEMSKR